MRAVASIVLIALAAGCAEPSSDFTPVEATGTLQSSIDSLPKATTSAAEPPQLPPATAVVPDSAFEEEIGAPMTGVLVGVGSLNAVARIRLTEARKNVLRAELLLSGSSAAGWEVGLAQTLSQAQMQELVAGNRVVVDGRSGVGYGVPTQEVTRALNGVQMIETADGMTELRFFLGDEITRDSGAPTSVGQASELVVKGSLQIDCLVPGSVEPEKTLDDPRFSTAVCKNLLKNFHLEGFASVK